MSFLKKTLRCTMLGALGLLTLNLGTSTATADTGATLLNFPIAPLFLGAAVEPNVILALDNSGSTDWEVSIRSNNGAIWWNETGGGTCSSSTLKGFSGCDADSSGDKVGTSSILNFNYGGSFTSSQWDGYGYVFPDGTTLSNGGKLYGDTGGTGGINVYSIPPIPAFGWSRSSAWNKAYFDPTQTYTPWITSTGTSFGNASTTAAHVDPQLSGALSFDLTSDAASNVGVSAATACASTQAAGTAGVADWGFRVFNGMTIPQNTCMIVTKTTCSGTSGTTKCSSNNPTAPTGGSCFNTGNNSTVYCTQPQWTSLAQDTPVAATSGATSSNYAISGDSHSAINDGTTQFIRYFPATFYLPAGTTSPYSNYTAAVLTGKDPSGANMDGYQIKPANFSGGASDPQYLAAIQNFANWFVYYRKRFFALQNGVGSAFNDLAINIRVAEFIISDNSSSSNLTMLRTANATDKSTFYSNVYALQSGGGTPNIDAVRHIGQQYRTNTNIITSVCQKNFGILFTDGYTNANPSSITYTSPNGGTALNGNVDGSSNTNYTLFGSNTNPYKDSTSNTMADETMFDYVGPLRTSGNDTNNIPYSGSKKVQVNPACPTNTSGVPTGVPPAGSPTMDCNPQLHMDFYGVILNTTGFVYDGTTNATTNAYSSAPTWPTTLARQDASQVDDLWHATINGRGKLLNATSPADVATQLSNVLNSITAETAAAGAVALNTTTLKTITDVYEATFFSGDWHGDLYSFPILSDGSVGNPATWDAGTVLENQIKNGGGPSSRTILTFNHSTGTGYGGVPFTTSGIDATETALLNINPDSLATDTYGALRLAYLRGDQSHEAVNQVPRFRSRPTTVLGDIADSSPVFVGVPSFLYSDSSYATFKSNHATRTPMIYVGANDGMLHGFEADVSTNGGKELLAYVPSRAFGLKNGSTVQPTLSLLTQQTYTHQYVVDGSPTVIDAQVNGSWKTVLVGSMRTGGKQIFALDVTDPSGTYSGTTNVAFSESNAANIAMWEFSNADDADFGYSFSKPSIVKMANGKWAAIVGNGYNNTDTAGGADANYSGASGNTTTATSHVGQPYLYIIFLNGPTGTNHTWTAGTDYIKIAAGSGITTSPNGLAEPVAVDVDGDGVVDYIYAGDLQGKMWRFNVTDSSASNWKTAFSVSGNVNGQPIFIAKDYAGGTLPITERPDVGYNLNQANPNSLAAPKLAVYFGTGRYIDSGDSSNTSQQTQSFFAIFDDFADVASGATTPTAIYRDSSSGTPASNMLKQSILFQKNASGANCAVTDDCFRITSNNSLVGTEKGWFIDLYNTDVATEATAVSSSLNKGEKQVSQPVLRSGRIVFTTLIPSTDPCTFGGGGYLMELNSLSGSRLSVSPIDVNNNGSVDSGDTITVNGVAYSVSGQSSDVGILSTPAILNLGGNGTLENKFLGGSQAAIATVTESASNRGGRISWREIIP